MAFIRKSFLSYSLVSVLLLCCQISFAKDDFEKLFKQGREKYLEAKYAEAMNTLLPLTKENSKNMFIEKAHYFYALSAFKDKKFQEAYFMLLQLIQKYGTWKDIDEAKYLASASAFELKKYRYALNFIKEPNEKLKNDADELKLYYIPKIQPLDTLIAIQKSYPKDEILASILIEKIAKPALSNEKLRMLQQYLRQEFKASNSEQKASTEPQLKDVYNVGVLSPFMVNVPEYDNYVKSNAYVFDMYFGMQVAIDSLRKIGTNINLFAYDSGRDSTKLASVLIKNEMANLDMLVGPILPLHNNALSTYVNNEDLILVNPISNNSKLGLNPMISLFQPSLEAQVSCVLDVAKKLWINKDKNKVAIFYSDNPKDSLMAKFYRDSLLANKILVPIYERIKKDKLTRITSILSDSNKLKGYSHVFVTTTDEISSATFISALEKSLSSIPMVTRSEWLSMPTLNLEQMQKRNIHFIYPEFVSLDNPYLDFFKKNYTQKFNILPSIYSYIGYELMYFYGKALKEYGTDLINNLPKIGAINGTLFPGFRFTGSKSNQFCSIVKFEEMKLKLVNVPNK